MYSCAAASTALPVGVSIWTFGGPALWTSTVPIFKTEVLTARILGDVMLDCESSLPPPPHDPATTTTDRTSAAAPAARLLVVLAYEQNFGVRWRRVTRAIFSFARR